jgi:hypothetical protein
MDRVPPEASKIRPTWSALARSAWIELLSHLDPGPAEESEAFVRLIYESAVLMSPPNATARLVVDTDVASFGG